MGRLRGGGMPGEDRRRRTLTSALKSAKLSRRGFEEELDEKNETKTVLICLLSTFLCLFHSVVKRC